MKRIAAFIFCVLLSSSVFAQTSEDVKTSKEEEKATKQAKNNEPPKKEDYNSRDDFNTALKGTDEVLLISGMDDRQKKKSRYIMSVERKVLTIGSQEVED